MRGEGWGEVGRVGVGGGGGEGWGSGGATSDGDRHQ